ncbi:MAG: hypothetical protein GTN99_07670, partial [Candidatus Dadabacteria bacterium]|nr:hypothetical protein [Candidatus Dadabacteria bacterium]
MEEIINNLSGTLNINPDDFIIIAGLSVLFIVTLTLFILVRDEMPAEQVPGPQEDDSEVSGQDAALTEHVTPPEHEALEDVIETDIEEEEQVASEPSEQFTAKTETEDIRSITEADTAVEVESIEAEPEPVETEQEVAVQLLEKPSVADEKP